MVVARQQGDACTHLALQGIELGDELAQFLVADRAAGVDRRHHVDALARQARQQRVALAPRRPAPRIVVTLIDREETRQERSPGQAGGEQIVAPAHHRLRQLASLTSGLGGGGQAILPLLGEFLALAGRQLVRLLRGLAAAALFFLGLALAFPALPPGFAGSGVVLALVLVGAGTGVVVVVEHVLVEGLFRRVLGDQRIDFLRRQRHVILVG